MKCPNCDLINPENAQRCDCGFNFTSETIEKSYVYETGIEKIREIRTGIINQIAGFGLLFIVIFIPLITVELFKNRIEIFGFISSIILCMFCVYLYFASPIAFTFDEKFLTVRLLFNIKLKYEWRNIKGISEMHFVFYKRAFLHTSNMVFIIEEYGMKEYKQFLAKINYWVNRELYKNQ